MEVVAAEPAGDIEHFANEKQPGLELAFHGFGTDLVGVDAAEGDARMGGQGVAVSVEITTDPAMAPADVSGETL